MVIRGNEIGFKTDLTKSNTLGLQLVQSFQNKQAIKTICYKVSNCYAILESVY
jgi:two-component sensor histidine kinase